MSLSGGRPAVTRVAETASSWDGAPLPAYPAGRPQVTILRATIPPHATLPRHTHAVVNAGVILRGELTVVSDNGTERTSAPARVSWSWSVRSITAKTAATGRPRW
ncbi:MAG: hypothetical protein V8Q35_00825 [Alistipes finegoldii]